MGTFFHIPSKLIFEKTFYFYFIKLNKIQMCWWHGKLLINAHNMRTWSRRFSDWVRGVWIVMYLLLLLLLSYLNGIRLWIRGKKKEHTLPVTTFSSVLTYHIERLIIDCSWVYILLRNYWWEVRLNENSDSVSSYRFNKGLDEGEQPYSITARATDSVNATLLDWSLPVIS